MSSIYTNKRTKEFKRISKAIKEARNTHDGYINCNKIADNLETNHTAVLKVFSHIMPEFKYENIGDDKVEEIYKIDEFEIYKPYPEQKLISYKNLLLFEEEIEAPQTKYEVKL